MIPIGFEKHLPNKVQPIRSKEPLKNWKQLDDEISKDVKRICLEILRSVNPIRRVNYSEIIRRETNKIQLEQRERKLPKSTAIINRYYETYEDFKLRMMSNVEERFITEKGLPTKPTF